MQLERSYYDPAEWSEEPGTPGMFFYPTEEAVLAFARQLLAEADRAG